MDIWFTRNGSSVWFAWAEPGEPPNMLPQRASTIRDAYRHMRKAGIEIGQVGIADSDMLGFDE